MQSHQIWRYQRFLIVFEYSEKPPLPPPVNTVYYVYIGIRYMIKKLNICYHRYRRGIFI